MEEKRDQTSFVKRENARYEVLFYTRNGEISNSENHCLINCTYGCSFEIMLIFHRLAEFVLVETFSLFFLIKVMFE